jgi:tight adherence protein C
MAARAEGTAAAPPGALDDFVAKHFQGARFGISGSAREKLRLELIRAGYFRSEAVNYYIFWRMASVVLLPGLAYALVQIFMRGKPWQLQVIVIAISVVFAIAAPDAYIARKKRLLLVKYRQTFPDLMDMLLVCIDAGLSLNAAFDRIGSEIIRQNRELALNLIMMGAETRAGRSMIDALEALAERLALDEARSLVLVLRQSIELGSDVGETLRIFSDDMRDRRILRAEEGAAKLPVKMVLPMALCIFPTILLVILFPLALRLLVVISHRH